MKKVVDEAAFDAAISQGTTAVLFHATWCPYCRRYLPIFIEESAGRDGLVPVEAVIDDESNPLWNRFEIEIVPTVIVFKDGAVVKRLDGKPGRGLGPGDLAAVL